MTELVTVYHTTALAGACGSSWVIRLCFDLSYFPFKSVLKALLEIVGRCSLSLCKNCSLGYAGRILTILLATDKAQGKALQTATNGKLFLQRKCIGGAFLTRKNYSWIKEYRFWGEKILNLLTKDPDIQTMCLVSLCMLVWFLTQD